MPMYNGKMQDPCPHYTLTALRAWAHRRYPNEPKSKWAKMKGEKGKARLRAIFYNSGLKTN